MMLIILLERIANSLGETGRRRFGITIYVIWMLFCISVPIIVGVILYKIFTHTL